MGKIYLVSSDEGVRYRAVAFEPGTSLSDALNDPERLVIAVFATPGANMSKLRVSRVLKNPDPTDDYELESFLPCNADTTEALLATGFAWDNEAREYADTFAVSPADVHELEQEIVRLHQSHLAKLMKWMDSRGGEPPTAPWA